ncbi:MotA/TolQ/ExbB proton channel family protein [Robiginitomaculum antarcticum]|uniref:MotA/TolQ/ExbB proton channel family protein n=1 Tax=Robiginitomaculum antarcticum TaxID=437507 RepID=UPI00037C96EE|nr:MotA/TolQ/ExbB proton channel family protein [Robiginitomaculum antarcticum]
MNKFVKTAALAMGGVMLMSTPASAQITSIDDLLGKVRQDARQAEQDNRQRVADFEARRSEQAAILGRAKAELNQLEARARQVQNTFDANDGRIATLKGELKTAQGEFGEVFGLARTKAGEFKALLDSSIVTAEYPNRTAVLGTIADSEALPSAEQLNEIWQLMLQEVEAQREVKTFTADVANMGENVNVMRVGAFNAFTEDGANFVRYVPPKDDKAGFLTTLPKQPSGVPAKAAAKVTNASAGDLVAAPIDPTRGSLLQSFERVPNKLERIQQGGIIGWIIVVLAVVGILFGLLRILMLLGVSAAVRKQTRSAQASSKNPLGRVMLAADEARGGDEETLELKMDEAILRESPKLERGLNILKLAAGIAPLLGLLGTVTGMIKTFQAMMIYGTGDPQLMAGGISEALVTTMLGLIAAIPLLILHSFCSSLARGVQNTLEEQSAGIVARQIENRRI